MDGMAGLAPKGTDAAHPAGQYGAIAKLFHWVTLGLMLMALPLVPMHESCPVTPVFSAGDPAVEADQAKPNPFAVLSQLKKN